MLHERLRQALRQTLDTVMHVRSFETRPEKHSHDHEAMYSAPLGAQASLAPRELVDFSHRPSPGLSAIFQCIQNRRELRPVTVLMTLFSTNAALSPATLSHVTCFTTKRTTERNLADSCTSMTHVSSFARKTLSESDLQSPNVHDFNNKFLPRTRSSTQTKQCLFVNRQKRIQPKKDLNCVLCTTREIGIERSCRNVRNVDSPLEARCNSEKLHVRVRKVFGDKPRFFSCGHCHGEPNQTNPRVLPRQEMFPRRCPCSADRVRTVGMDLPLRILQRLFLWSVSAHAHETCAVLASPVNSSCLAEFEKKPKLVSFLTQNPHSLSSLRTIFPVSLLQTRNVSLLTFGEGRNSGRSRSCHLHRGNFR